MRPQQRWILSGPMASGKSTVRSLLEQAGITTIDSDRIGHEVLLPGHAAAEEVAQEFPGVQVDGEIDRSRLAAIVFADRRRLEQLESITHPHIFDTITGMVEEIEGTVVVEIPLLHHRLGDDWPRIVVDTAPAVSVRRAVDRGMSLEDAEARIAIQPRREEWLAVADLVLPNHGGLDELEDSVRRLAGAIGRR